MPGNQPAFSQYDGAENGKAEGGEDEDDGEGQVGMLVAVRDDNIVAETGIAAQHLGDGGADGRVDGRTLQADEELRQCGRQPDLEEGADRAGSGRQAEAAELDAERGEGKHTVQQDGEE